MSLTTNDLQQIRAINVEGNEKLDGKVTALQNDVKEIYYMIAKMEKETTASSKKFLKLSLEKKILKTNSNLLIIAKQAGISLPRT